MDELDLTIDEASIILGIKTKRKKNEICFKRAWFWQMIYDNKEFEISSTKLGKITGQTHASVLHGINQARRKEPWLMAYKDEVEKIVKRIKF